jgi:hypothetical protein
MNIWQLLKNMSMTWLLSKKGRENMASRYFEPIIIVVTSDKAYIQIFRANN